MGVSDIDAGRSVATATLRRRAKRAFTARDQAEIAMLEARIAFIRGRSDRTAAAYLAEQLAREAEAAERGKAAA
jgi:hypothetical protein